MGTPIRIRKNGWGTCFCVRRAGAIRFITARQVLIGCGCTFGAATFRAYLCDADHEEILHDLTNIAWDDECDYAEFDCSILGDPYVANSAQIRAGAAIHTRGYLRRAGRLDDMPGRDSPSEFGGLIVAANRDGAPGRRLVTLKLQIADPYPAGLTGSPVTLDRSGEVVSVFCGGPPQCDGRSIGVEVSER